MTALRAAARAGYEAFQAQYSAAVQCADTVRAMRALPGFPSLNRDAAWSFFANSI